MATKRRPPPKKKPSPPPTPHSDSEVDEDLQSGSEEEPEVEQDRKSSESEESGGDDSGGDHSGSDPEQLPPNPPRPRTGAADDKDDYESEEEDSESGEEDSESEEEQPNPSSKDSNVARPAEVNGNPSDDKSVPVSESAEEDSESEDVQTNPSPRSSAVTHPANASGNQSDKQSVLASRSGEDVSESEEEQPNPSPRNSAIANVNPLEKKSVPASESRKVAATPPKAATGETTKKLFQRIWSDEDQIALLQGMVGYVGANGKDPVANIEDFGLFIRRKLSFPVTVSQLMSKIKNVRTKYIRSSNKGKERAFRKAYDAEVFELSKKVWGAAKEDMAVKNGENGGVKKRKGVQLDKKAVQDSPHDELLVAMPWDDEVINLCKEHFGCNEYSARVKINSMEESERKSLLPRWKKLKMEEVRCFENRRSLEFDTLETIFNCP